MSHTIETNQDTPYIDHPSQPGWIKFSILDSQSEGREAELERRFAGTEEDMPELISAVDVANMRAAAYRQERELVNRQHLAIGLGEAEVAEHYSVLAGRPERVGEYIHWFGSAALQALDCRSPRDKFNSVSLELGGIQQIGDWNCTNKLDKMAESLPTLVAEADSAANVQMAPKSGRRVGYVLLPLFVDESGQFNHAILRRRRAVADIVDTEGNRLEVFKQSNGLVVVNMLDPRDQVKIRTAVAEHSDPRWNVQKNNTIANIAGTYFEEAIRQKDRSQVTTVVPISAQYLMQVRAVESGLGDMDVAA